jgi:SWI/SNF-related matrix-associated actin-dependent regulator of chromatin subfamily A3
MAERERGWNFQNSSSDIWRRSMSADGTPLFVTLFPYDFRALEVLTDEVSFFNTILGIQQNDAPPDFRGGILADAPGLGKSLSIIALIVSDRHPTNPANDAKASQTLLSGDYGYSAATLLIVPPSRM